MSCKVAEMLDASATSRLPEHRSPRWNTPAGSARRDDLRDAKHRHIKDCESGAVVKHLPMRGMIAKKLAEARPSLNRFWVESKIGTVQTPAMVFAHAQEYAPLAMPA